MNSRQLMAGAVGLAMTFLVAAAQVAPASVIASFDNNTDGNPFRTSLVNGGTSVGGELTDPDFNGGTAFTVTIANPRTGVDITTPASPDFTNATVSTFGAEPTGFGVGNASLGRFERGESFTLHTTHALTINSMGFHEYNGDEDVHIAWTQGGVAKSQVFSMAGGTGSPPSNVTVTLSGIQVDANTTVTFTNVSSSSANASGRLRIRRMEFTLVPEPASMSILGLCAAALLRRRR